MTSADYSTKALEEKNGVDWKGVDFSVRSVVIGMLVFRAVENNAEKEDQYYNNNNTFIRLGYRYQRNTKLFSSFSKLGK